MSRARVEQCSRYRCGIQLAAVLLAIDEERGEHVTLLACALGPARRRGPADVTAVLALRVAPESDTHTPGPLARLLDHMAMRALDEGLAQATRYGGGLG
jgi:hypothetical protein